MVKNISIDYNSFSTEKEVIEEKVKKEEKIEKELETIKEINKEVENIENTKDIKENKKNKENIENKIDLNRANVLAALSLLTSDATNAFIDKDKTIRNGKEECDSYREYIEIYLRNKELAAGGFLCGTSYGELPGGSSGKSPDSKFIGYITTAEKKKPLQEFDKLLVSVAEMDERCAKYLYLTYYKNLTPGKVNKELGLKNRFEGYRILKRAYFIVACLADEVVLISPNPKKDKKEEKIEIEN